MKNSTKDCCTLYFIMISIFSLGAQEGLSLPDNVSIPLIMESEYDLKERMNALKDYDYSMLSKRSKETYNMISAVYSTYFHKDSAQYYLYKAYNSSPSFVCRLVVSGYKQRQYLLNRGEISDKRVIFLDDIPNFNEVEFAASCNKLLDSIRVTKKKEIRIVRPEIEEIQSKDRKYRNDKEIDWDLQNALDYENRCAVDSLYNQAGSLLKFSEEELSIFSFVLHHSDDCDWNMKWTDIIFREKKENSMQGTTLLQEAIRRMFKKDVGICFIRDSEKVNSFISSLRQKYPKISEVYLNNI